MFQPRKNSPGKFIQPTDIVERTYKEHLIEKNLKLAERYVAESKARRLKLEQDRAKEKRRARKNKRRVAAQRADIATGAVVAKARIAREPGVEYESDGSDSEEDDIKESSSYVASLSSGNDGDDDSATVETAQTYKEKLSREKELWSAKNLLAAPLRAARWAALAAERAASRKALDLYLKLRIATTRKKRERFRRFLYHQLIKIPVALGKSSLYI